MLCLKSPLRGTMTWTIDTRQNMNKTKVMISLERQNVMQKAGFCGRGIGNN